MENIQIDNIDLSKYGFIGNTLETKYHMVTYFFCDVGRLIIKAKPQCGGDSVYIEDFFTADKFSKLIYYITGYNLKI